MNPEISLYNKNLSTSDQELCDLLAKTIDAGLSEAENKIWHSHPVWFLEGNPIVGYDRLKAGIRLMFWSGMGFEEAELKPGSGKFKDASILFTSTDQVDTKKLNIWLEKSRTIQWDYKNIVKHKGRLDRIV